MEDSHSIYTETTVAPMMKINVFIIDFDRQISLSHLHSVPINFRLHTSWAHPHPHNKSFHSRRVPLLLLLPHLFLRMNSD
jgi:hypothetical protein